MKRKIAIFGGSQEVTFKKIAKKNGCDVVFHNGKSRNGGNKKEFRNVIKKADCVVVLYDALGHISMDIVKELSKKMDKPIDFIPGRGATGAVNAGLQLLQSNEAA